MRVPLRITGTSVISTSVRNNYITIVSDDITTSPRNIRFYPDTAPITPVSVPQSTDHPASGAKKLTPITFRLQLVANQSRPGKYVVRLVNESVAENAAPKVKDARSGDLGTADISITLGDSMPRETVVIKDVLFVDIVDA